MKLATLADLITHHQKEFDHCEFLVKDAVTSRTRNRAIQRRTLHARTLTALREWQTMLAVQPVCARCKSPDHHVSDCEFGA